MDATSFNAGKTIASEANVAYRFRIVGALEGADAMRLKAVRLPQALHGAQADADGFGHGAPGPMCGLPRRLGAGQLQDLGDDPGGKRRPAEFGRLVAQQPLGALFAVSPLTASDGGPGDAGSARDFQRRKALGGEENDARPLQLHMLERAIAVGNDRQQALAIFGGRNAVASLGHAAKLAQTAELVNPMTATVH